MMQFKSPKSRLQSNSKRSTSQFKRVQSRSNKSASQFKSPGSTKQSNMSAPATQTKPPTLIAMSVKSRTLIKQPTISVQPQTLTEQPTMVLPTKAQIQVPVQSAQVVTQSPRIAFRVFAICLASTAVTINSSNYGPLIPALSSALHINGGQVGLFSTLFFIGIIVSCVPSGILSDRFGSRPILLVTLSLSTTGSLLLPVFPDFIWMLACRGLIGLGAGATLVSCGHACAQLGKHEPLGQGLRGGAVQLGVGLGLVSMSFLQGLLGWRNALFVCGILGVIALIVLLWYPKEVRSTSGGSQLAERPALAIRVPTIWMLGLANMGTFGLINAIMAWISVYFINLYGLPLVFAGTLGSAALFAGIFFQLLGGLLLARLQKPVLLIRVGTGMCFLSMIVLALPFHWFVLAIIGLILFAVGTTLPTSAIFSTASMAGKVSGAGAGISQALVAILASLAAVTGAPLIGLVLERTGSFTTALGSVALVFPAIAVTASLFLGFALKPTQRKSLALNS